LSFPYFVFLCLYNNGVFTTTGIKKGSIFSGRKSGRIKEYHEWYFVTCKKTLRKLNLLLYLPFTLHFIEGIEGTQDFFVPTYLICCSLCRVYWFRQGKKVCKVNALRCYQCFSLRFLLATAKWLTKKLQGSFVNSAGAQ